MIRWVLLAYRLPREPSTPRIAIWRRLRRLGVAQLTDGLVALPYDARTREQFEWLADDVVEHGGEAWVWYAEAGSAAQERAVAARIAATVAEEYVRVADEAAALAGGGAANRRALARLRRDLRRIASHDYFPTPERDRATEAVEHLARRLRVAA